MKKNFFLIGLLFVVCSCSSTKSKFSPINAYLTEKVKTNDSIIIIANKINNNYTLDLWKKRASISENPNIKESSIDENPRVFEEKFWIEMNSKYRNHDKNIDSLWLKQALWQQKDFKSFKVKFISENTFPKPYLYNEYNKAMDKKNEMTVFSFSEPMIYKKKYVVFAKAITTTKQKYIEPRSFVIMKIENGKWKIVKEINDGYYD